MTLAANQTGHIEFKVEAKDGITKDTWLKLINDIKITPRDGASEQTIASPQAKVFEKKAITINNKHTGDKPMGVSITGDLYRNETQIGTVELGLDGNTKTPDLRVKDDDGNLYTYSIRNISTNNDRVSPVEDRVDITNGTATINTKYVEDSKVNITVKLDYTGNSDSEITGVLKRKSGEAGNEVDDAEFSKNFTLSSNQKILPINDLDKLDKDNKSYTYYAKLTDYPDNIVIESVTAQESTITIKARDAYGFNISTMWNGLKPVGSIDVTLSNNQTITLDDSNSYYYHIDGAEAELYTVESIKGTDEENYEYTLIGESSPYTVSVRKINSKVPNIDVTNAKAPTSNFKLKKTNEDGSEVLSGAEFTLKKADENWQEIDGTNPIVRETDNNGYANFDNIPIGNYLMSETKAPYGYQKTDYVWKVQVEEDKVTVVNDREYETSYQVVNPNNTKGLNYYSYTDWYGKDHYEPLIDFSTNMEAIPDSTSYYITISYKGRDSRNNNYGYYYWLIIDFDFNNFNIIDVTDGNNTKISEADSWKISSGKDYFDGENVVDNSSKLTYKVTPKNNAIPNGPTMSPIRLLKYANGNFGEIDNSYYPKLNPVTKLETKPLVLDTTGDKAFEYSTINTKLLANAEFVKVDNVNTDTKLKDAVFELEKKNDDGTYTSLDRVFVSDVNGKIVLNDLEVGEYRLIETSPPTGYRPPVGYSKEFKIDEKGNTLVKDKEGNFVENTGEAQEIKNIKLGEFDFEFTKKDASTGDPIDGVVFEIRNSDGVPVGVQRVSGQSSKPGIDPDVPGKVKFTELTPGKYWIYEIDQKDGYIKSKKPMQVVIGEEYDVPENPENPKDISQYFRLDPLKPSTLMSTTDNEYTVYPNETEGMMAKLHFVIDDSVKVNPGDTFTLELSDNVDIFGINDKSKDGDRDFDIYGPMGRLAVASVRDDRRTIDYTFTKALEDYDKVNDITINTPMFVERLKVPFNTNGMQIKATIGDAVFADTINVNYDAPNNYGYINNRENVKTYQLKLNQETGEFTSIIYVNPWRKNDGNKKINFWTNISSTIKEVDVYKTTSKSPKELPWSFAINYNNLPYGLEKLEGDLGLPRTVNLQNPLHIDLGTGYNSDQYIIEVKGVVNGEGDFETRTEYKRNSYYYEGQDHYYNYWGQTYYDYNDAWDYWYTYVAHYKPSSDTNAERIMYNKKNKIEYTKMSGKLEAVVPKDENEGENSGDTPPDQGEDTEYKVVPDKVLSGAEFELHLAGEAKAVEGSQRKSGEDGKFYWEGLAPGKYEVWEIKAPEGYTLPTDYVSSFEVNENGEIVKIENNTTIIINEKDDMYFKLQKIWKKSEGNDLVDTPINIGTLELKLQAPTGQTFGTDIKAEESISEGKYYRIKEVSENKDYIILEVDLKKAADAKVHESGIQIDVLSDWPSGDYTLTETKAPAGFKKTDKEFTINIDQENQKITFRDPSGDSTKDLVLYEKTTTDSLGILKIENERGLFPSTGGMGTVIFTVVGMVAMAIAFIGYRRKRVRG